MKTEITFSSRSDLSNYQFKDTIGQGNFGKVKLALFIPTKEKYAIKILSKSRIESKNEMHLVQRELKIIKNFNHINVININQIIEDESSFYIIMEYCQKGELFDYIVSHERLNENESSMFFFQLINGIEHIHSQSVVHRDLKPENLLLNSEKVLKIIDFGLSSPFDGQTLLRTKCGSPSYASPELIRGEAYNGFKTDIWCCGIILYAMLCGYLPFEGENNKELFKNILECNLEFPEFVSEKAKETIMKILTKTPEERASIEDIKKMEYYKKGRELYYEQYRDITVDNSAMKKSKKKMRGLRIVNSSSETLAFRKRIQNINLIKNQNKKGDFSLASKISDIIQIDEFKKLGKINALVSPKIVHNIHVKKDNVQTNFEGKLFNRKFVPKFSLKQLIESKFPKHEIPLMNNIHLKRKSSSSNTTLQSKGTLRVNEKKKEKSQRVTMNRAYSLIPTEAKYKFQRDLVNIGKVLNKQRQLTSEISKNKKNQNFVKYNNINMIAKLKNDKYISFTTNGKGEFLGSINLVNIKKNALPKLNGKFYYDNV